jgi:hypothetical protein
LRFLLIPVAHAVPSLCAFLDARPNEASPLTTEELQQLVRLALRVIRTGEVLLDYTLALSGRPSMN